MAKLLKILPIFILTALVVAGCDFGKSPDMDKVRDALYEDYGEELAAEEQAAMAEDAKGSTADLGECDAECQEQFRAWMVGYYGEDWETTVAQEDIDFEFELFMDAREFFTGGQ